MTQYNIRLPEGLTGFCNVAEFDEFFEYCEEKDLSPLQMRILRHILGNSKEWDLSPKEIAKKFGKEKRIIQTAINGGGNRKGLLDKLEGDIEIIQKSNGTDGKGHKIDATKCYMNIYNRIVGGANGNNRRDYETTNGESYRDNKPVEQYSEDIGLEDEDMGEQPATNSRNHHRQVEEANIPEQNRGMRFGCEVREEHSQDGVLYGEDEENIPKDDEHLNTLLSFLNEC